MSQSRYLTVLIQVMDPDRPEFVGSDLILVPRNLLDTGSDGAQDLAQQKVGSAFTNSYRQWHIMTPPEAHEWKPEGVENGRPGEDRRHEGVEGVGEEGR